MLKKWIIFSKSLNVAKSRYEQRSEVERRQQNMRQEILGSSDPVLDITLDDQSNVQAAEEFLEVQKTSVQTERNRAKAEKKDGKFDRTEKHKLMPSERQVLRQTFDHLGQHRITVFQINEALENSQEFKNVYSEFKAREQKPDNELKRTIQESYRAMHRKK